MESGQRASLMSVLLPSLQIGGLSGLSGLFVGSISGVALSSRPGLFAIASGIQWFALGSTYWATRVSLRQRLDENQEHMVSISAAAGGVAGATGALLRGRKNFLAGIIMFTLFGAAGQSIYNITEQRAKRKPAEAESTRGWLESKWSPLKVLSDQEYENVLAERLVRVDAEIAAIDASIESLNAVRASKLRSG